MFFRRHKFKTCGLYSLECKVSEQEDQKVCNQMDDFF